VMSLYCLETIVDVSTLLVTLGGTLGLFGVVTCSDNLTAKVTVVRIMNNKSWL
jgi:hypothetical protein